MGVTIQMTQNNGPLGHETHAFIEVLHPPLPAIHHHGVGVRGVGAYGPMNLSYPERIPQAVLS